MAGAEISAPKPAALIHLAESRKLLDAQGMAAWAAYALSQTAVAHAFCNEAAAADEWMHAARVALKRFPIWESHVCEAQYMVFGHRKDPSTWTAHLQAVRAAREWGLVARHARLLAAIKPQLNTQPQAVFWTKPPWSA